MNASARPTYKPATEARASPGRGLGCFATRKIEKFTVFLVDEPLISFGANMGVLAMADKVNGLPAEARATWDSLVTADPEIVDADNNVRDSLARMSVPADRISECVRMATVVQANAFAASGDGAAQPHSDMRDGRSSNPADPRSTHRRSIFADVSRINHSCVPNAHAHFRAAWGAMVLHALRDIEQGEEIFISYVKITEPRRARQERLSAWGFECACEACAPGPRSDEHAALVVQLQVAMRLGTRTMELAHSSPPGSPVVERSAAASVQKLRAALAALDQPSRSYFKPTLPTMYNLLATIETVAPQDDDADEEAIEGFRKAFMHESHITGSDSPGSIKHRQMLLDREHLQRQMEAQAGA